MTPNERIIRLISILIEKYPGPVQEGLIELMIDIRCSCYQRDINPYDILTMVVNEGLVGDGLTPVDFECCQAVKVESYSFMRLGKPALKRCDNKPTYMIVECKPGKDGKRGSMSLCDECLDQFCKTAEMDVNVTALGDSMTNKNATCIVHKKGKEIKR